MDPALEAFRFELEMDGGTKFRRKSSLDQPCTKATTARRGDFRAASLGPRERSWETMSIAPSNLDAADAAGQGAILDRVRSQLMNDQRQIDCGFRRDVHIGPA